MENKMGRMPINKLVWNISLPIMISMLVSSLYNIVDSIFVAMISTEALTATSIAYSAQILQLSVAVGTSVGMNSLVSRLLGEGKLKRASSSSMTGLIISILSSMFFMILGLFSHSFMTLFTTNPDIISMGTSYLKICLFFSTGIFLATYSQRLLQSTGNTVSSMYSQIAGGVINLILDPLLIFGIGVFPKLGITGAAIATIIGQWGAGLIGMYLNKRQNKEIKLTFKDYHF